MLNVFPREYYSLLRQTGSILLETAKFDSENSQSFLFLKPQKIITTTKFSEIPACFQEIQDELEKGNWVTGYFAYECGAFFEERIQFPENENPLLWLGVYSEPSIFDHQTGLFQNPPPVEPDQKESYQVSNFSFSYSKEEYQKKISKIKSYIQNGETYQINFTGESSFSFQGSPLALYQALQEKQQVSYSAFLNQGDQQIISLSPELFFLRDREKIASRPMKGTIQRGQTQEEDQRLKNLLQSDEKSRAENVMIVDLIRNDLGKVAELGSVKTSKMFEIEEYQTLHQMTSTVEAKLKKEVSYFDIFQAIFPCGSVTGAPKIRSMEIIQELEDSPRGVYTGAIGYFSPEDKAVFNVPIRTVSIKENQGLMGIGSGVVWDSVAEHEFKECLLKAKFLQDNEQFSLIETMLWENAHLPYLGLHLKRVLESAKNFDIPLQKKYFLERLSNVTKNLKKTTRYKVRCLVSQKGEVSIETTNLKQQKFEERTIAVLDTQENFSENPFFFHKTTKRELYKKAFQQAQKLNFADILFSNEKGELTEGSISNLFIVKGGVYYTPPVSCGLLNGVFRQYLLHSLPNVEEKVLTYDDLLSADQVYLTNAIQKMRRIHHIQKLETL
ncbi:MAG: para-aminobenzoate synthetase/4-amino-4-deoxychorismate lyase [bacterium]|jgi:para-aminobenzoate synthetase/4-amino-4-deoxychorismate lyase